MTFHPAIAVAAILAVSACGEAEPVCRNEIIREALSPDGEMKATLFRRACGGPTGESSQISILPADKTETGKGNAFIADTAGGAAPAAAWGGPDVAMEWTAPRALQFTYPSRARIVVGEPSVRGVAITYKSKD